ncbi:MAG: hypothetical protein AAFP02_02680, partial [Bacteroidota bacterium]
AGEEAALTWTLKDLPLMEKENELDLPPEETPALYQRLEKLNYRKHIPLLRKYLLRHDAGIFLIHGLPRYGQTWLASNRLTAFREMDGLDLPRAIQLGTQVASAAELVEAIKRSLRFGRGFESMDHEVELMSQKFFERLQNGPVLLRIHDVEDFLRNGLFDEFLDQFWQKLMLRLEARKAELQGQQFHKLVLLLIEEQTQMAEDHTRLICEVPDVATHDKILLLPDIPAVDAAEFSRWLEWDYNADESLFMNEFGHMGEDELQTWLGAEAKLAPEAFMTKICDQFDYYFEVNGQGQWQLE